MRDEFARLRDEFGTLSGAGKVTPESAVLMGAVFVLLELMVAIFLEKTTRKSSKNSSIPPSQSGADESATAAPGSNSKGSGGQDQRFDNARTVESVTLVPVTTCGCCGEDLSGVAAEGHERRTRIDIVFEKTIEHVDAEIKCCPACAKRTKGEFAADLMGPMQYGLGVKAYVVNLLASQMVSLNRTAKLMHAILGQRIAEATMLRFVMELYWALGRWEEATAEALLASPVIHLDETSMKVNGKKQWVHVVSAGNLVLKRVHPKRGLEAIRAHGILPRYGGVRVHDCWASYFSAEFAGARDALCGSHLLRELAFVEESNGYAWAGNLRRLLQEACGEVSASETKCLDETAYARLQRRYRNLLTRAEREMPPIPVRQGARGGKVAKS
ncbi:MAG: transposase, partial [Rhodothermaceae bacterium]|nr:transposase [Rhodothermaceae bacterium]